MRADLSDYEKLRAEIAARRFDARIEEEPSPEDMKEYQKIAGEPWQRRQVFLASVAAREATVDADILLAWLFPVESSVS